MIKVPCRGCKNRVPATKERPSCHANCSLYAEYQKGRKKEYEMTRKKGIIDAYESRRSHMIATGSKNPTFPNRQK